MAGLAPGAGRIYFAGAFVDNAYWGTGHPPFATNQYQDKITFWVDGDHLGRTTDASIVEEGRYRLENQLYEATPWISEGPNVIMPWVTHAPLEAPGDWMVHPPYCESGGSVIGEQPTIWVIEFHVTPFDLLVALEPEENVVSDLTAGKVIGLYLTVFDRDSPDRRIQARYQLQGVDVLLSRDQADSVVRDRTWDRIKAALELDR